MKLSQQLVNLNEMRDEVEASGVLHVDSVFESCLRDEQREERIARRYNRTRTVESLNRWLNARGIFQTKPETWPKRPPVLNLFKPNQEQRAV